MTEGPQATRYNPVFEALHSLEEMDRIEQEQEARYAAQGEGNTFLPAELMNYHAARAVAWSLLASVTGGQSIDLTPRDEGDEASGEKQSNALAQQAKAAFGG